MKGKKLKMGTIVPIKSEECKNALLTYYTGMYCDLLNKRKRASQLPCTNVTAYCCRMDEIMRKLERYINDLGFTMKDCDK